EDPARLGLVASLARPGGNVTGVNFFALEVAAKRLELLRQLVPSAVRVAVLVSPANARSTETTLREVELAACTIGLQIQVLNADPPGGSDPAFAPLARVRFAALFVTSGPFLGGGRLQLAPGASRIAIPAIFSSRQHVEAGGLMSYGASFA